MKEFLTADYWATYIRIQRSSPSETLLLVEGSSDRAFYKRFFSCQIIIISGKPSNKQLIVEVLKKLNQVSDFQGLLAIVDADLDRLVDSQEAFPNLLYTDSHDLETMLMNSPAFDKVLAEFGSEQKIEKFNRDIRLTILAAGIPVGYLLWISQQDNLNLTFQGIAFNKFIDEQTLEIDELKLIREVKNKSQAFSLKDEDLHQKLTHQKSKENDPWQVCCGHHLVEIFSFGLRKTIGSNKAADVEPILLERSLRLAYEETYFYKTQLYLHILNWESRNQPFKVLPSKA